MSFTLPKNIPRAKLLDFVEQDPLPLKVSFEKHLSAYLQTKDSSVLMSYFTLLTAIEVYLKIHVGIFAYCKWANMDETDQTNTWEWLSLFGARKNGFDVRRFSHDLPILLEEMTNFIELDQKIYEGLLKLLQKHTKKWTENRYATGNIPDREIIERIFYHFNELRNFLKSKNLDAIDKI